MNPDEAYTVLLQIVNRAAIGITEQHSVRTSFQVFENLIKEQKDAKAKAEAADQNQKPIES